MATTDTEAQRKAFVLSRYAQGHASADLFTASHALGYTLAPAAFSSDVYGVSTAEERGSLTENSKPPAWGNTIERNPLSGFLM
jgi:hypothetical protein